MKRFVLILIITSILNCTSLLSMEQEENRSQETINQNLTDQKKCIEAFLVFNEAYQKSLNPSNDELPPRAQQLIFNVYVSYAHIYDLAPMPYLKKTLKKASLYKDNCDIENLKKSYSEFLAQLNCCNTHIQSNPNLQKGKAALEQNCNKKLEYIAKIESQLTAPQFSLNNNFVKAIKKNPTDLESLTQLLSKGAQVDCKDVCSGNTALILAIKSFNIGLFSLLLEHNADVNLPNDSNSQFKAQRTPLIVTAHAIKFLNNKESNTEQEIIGLDNLKQMLFSLLDHGVDTTIPDENGNTIDQLVPRLINGYNSRKASLGI